MDLPSVARRSIYHFMTHRQISLIVDGKPSPLTDVQDRHPARVPAITLTFLDIFNVPFHRNQTKWCISDKIRDDITIYVKGSPVDNTRKLSSILAHCNDWTSRNYIKFDYGAKLQFMHVNNRRRQQRELFATELVLPGGNFRGPSGTTVLLGIDIDSQLYFGYHIATRKQKATRAIAQIMMLGGEVEGV